MGNYTNKILKEHSDILLGTVETHNCDPLMDCPECNGTGTCQECRGTGHVDCYNCHASGKCPDCHGRGQWTCDGCGGSGQCRKCNGSGSVTCSHCHGRGQEEYTTYDSQLKMNLTKSRNCPKCGGSGKTPCPDCRSGLQTAAKVADVLTFGAGRSYGSGSGRCSKCGGSGQIVCSTCHGSGDCQTCHGSGQLTCNHCGGSGNCPNCNHGKVTCTRCQGSGFYQTFVRQNTTLYAKGWKWSGSTEYSDIVGMASGTSLHNGPVKTWSDARTISADNIDAVNQKCIKELGEEKVLYGEFLDEYSKQTNLVKPNDDYDKPFAKTYNVQKVPVTKISYTINDQEYEMMIIGNNHIAAAKSIPTVIKGFELTKWQKIRLAMTERYRLKAYAMLAAYIFQCDGKSQEESVLLEAMIKACKLNSEKEKKFRSELNKLNVQMPYKQLRRKIRPLFLSKKTITFAWECMAIDKKVTPQEEELFAKIVAEYKLSESEIERYKGMAQRFARLKPDQIAKEYADLADEMAPLRKKIWRIIICSIAAIILIGLIVFGCIKAKEHDWSQYFESDDDIELYDDEYPEDDELIDDEYEAMEAEVEAELKAIEAETEAELKAMEEETEAELKAMEEEYDDFE